MTDRQRNTHGPTRPSYRVVVSFEVVPYRGTEQRWRDLLDQRAPALAMGLGSYRDLRVEAAEQVEREETSR